MDPRFGTGIPIGEDTTMITTDRDDYHDISNDVFVSYQTLRGSILDDTFFLDHPQWRPHAGGSIDCSRSTINSPTPPGVPDARDLFPIWDLGGFLMMLGGAWSAWVRLVCWVVILF